MYLVERLLKINNTYFQSKTRGVKITKINNNKTKTLTPMDPKKASIHKTGGKQGKPMGKQVKSTAKNRKRSHKMWNFLKTIISK